MSIKQFLCLSMTILILTISFQTISGKVDNTIPQPSILTNKFLLQQFSSSLQKQFSFPIRNFNYQLYGQVYQSQQSVFNNMNNNSESQSTANSIYNKSLYSKSKSCRYYRSYFKLDTIKEQDLNDTMIESSLYVEYDGKDMVYLIVNDNDQDDEQTSEENNNVVNRSLLLYQINHSNDNTIVLIKNVSLQQSNNISISNRQQHNVYMTNYNNQYILITDGFQMYSINIDQYKMNSNIHDLLIKQTKLKISHVTDSSQQFLGIKQVVYTNNKYLLFLYTNRISFYSLSSLSSSSSISSRFLTLSQYFSISSPIITKSISDTQLINLSQQHSIILILVQNKLFEYHSTQLSPPIIRQLDGEKCGQLYVYNNNIIHIICEQNRQNYIAQFYYSLNVSSNNITTSLFLNRFYTDLSNYLNVFYINNYIMMIGEDQIIIHSNGVNRNVILGMNFNPYTQRLASFDAENIVIIGKNRTKSNKNTNNNKENNNNDQNSDKYMLLACSQSGISILKLEHISGQVWCLMNNIPSSYKSNLLIVQNISQCQLNIQNHHNNSSSNLSHEISPASSICTNLIPIQLSYPRYQLQQKQSIIIFIIFIIILFVLSLLCLGYVFKSNSTYKEFVQDIKKKIKKIKKKEKEIKEI